MGEPGTGEGIPPRKNIESLDPPTLEPVAHVRVSVGGVDTVAEVKSDILRINGNWCGQKSSNVQANLRNFMCRESKKKKICS